MRFTGLLILVLFVLVIGVAAQSKIELSSSDKSQIIKSILYKEFKASQANNICLSTENLPDSVIREVPNIKSIKIKLSSPDKLGEEEGCTIEYYSFSKFEKKGLSWRVYFNKSENSGLSASGRRYSYRKVKGSWSGKIIQHFLARS